MTVLDFVLMSAVFGLIGWGAGDRIGAIVGAGFGLVICLKMATYGLG